MDMITFYWRLIFFALASEIPSAIYAFSSSALPAATLLRARVVKGMRASSRLPSEMTSPALSRAMVTPAGRKRGAAEAVTRQTARVQAIKPCTSAHLQNMETQIGFWKKKR